jgi:hypothetical protein
MRARQNLKIQPRRLQDRQTFAHDRHREAVVPIFREVDVDELPPLTDAMDLAIDELVGVAQIAEPLRSWASRT